ncbi:MAG: hypothetical protein R2724_29525 [Bryobacterales bacterium]
MSGLLFIFGTRPEAIKLAPLILRAQRELEVRVCSTGSIVSCSMMPWGCSASRRTLTWA